MATGITRKAYNHRRWWSGLVVYFALARLRGVNSSSLKTMMPPGCKSARLTFRAAGFMAIST